jgi:hypothetical protein
MGRRSRQRRSAPSPAPPAGAPAPPRAPRRRARLDEAPKAPWHPVPLVELAVLAGIVFLVLGLLSSGDERPILVFGGLGLVSVAALELAIREHLAGYRSHSTLLACAAAVACAVPLWFTPLPQEVLLVVALAVGAVAFRALRRVFERRAGGLTWKA